MIIVMFWKRWQMFLHGFWIHSDPLPQSQLLMTLKHRLLWKQCRKWRKCWQPAFSPTSDPTCGEWDRCHNTTSVFSSPEHAQRGAFRITWSLSSTISLNIFSHMAGPIWTRLGRNVPWDVLYKKCSQNLIPSKTLVAMVMKWNFLSSSSKISTSGTAGLILKYTTQNLLRITFF